MTITYMREDVDIDYLLLDHNISLFKLIGIVNKADDDGKFMIDDKEYVCIEKKRTASYFYSLKGPKTNEDKLMAKQVALTIGIRNSKLSDLFKRKDIKEGKIEFENWTITRWYKE